MVKERKEKKPDNKRKIKLILMVAITISLAGTYLYLQFDENFDPIYTEELKFNGESILEMSVDKHLKNGLNDYKLHMQDGTFMDDEPKMVEQIDDPNPEVVELIVTTNLSNGTKNYKLHISDNMGNEENEKMKLQEDLIKFTEIIKNLSCEELTQIINRDDLKDESFRTVTQAEFSLRC